MFTAVLVVFGCWSGLVYHLDVLYSFGFPLSENKGNGFPFEYPEHHFQARATCLQTYFTFWEDYWKQYFSHCNSICSDYSKKRHLAVIDLQGELVRACAWPEGDIYGHSLTPSGQTMDVYLFPLVAPFPSFWTMHWCLSVFLSDCWSLRPHVITSYQVSWLFWRRF